MPFTLLMLPPQTETTSAWAQRLAAELPFVRVVAAATEAEAAAAIPTAEAAFGTLNPQMLAAAGELKFELAARLRDEVADLKKELRQMAAAGHLS